MYFISLTGNNNDGGGQILNDEPYIPPPRPLF